MKTVLLVNSYGPHELAAWGEDPSDLMAARLARGHGVYQLNAHNHCWALYLIAENIRNPCTVLEHAHWEDFCAEVRKGYDVIGIQLKSLYATKVANMVRAIRELSPQTQIVIGGYGVASLEDRMPGDNNGVAEYLKQNVDHFCRSEGVRFMRRLLNDTPVDRPITQYHLPFGAVSMKYPFATTKPVPGISVSLGCPAGCDFCCTSACFFQQKINIASPSQVYDYMKSYKKRLRSWDYPSVFLYDEDLFLDPEYPRELGRLIRSDRKTWGMQWGTFGSVRTLSQFEPEELRECGCISIWVGVESTITEDGKTKTGFAKRHGTKSEKEIITGLRRCGIRVTASMILGFDFHTPDNIERDIDAFLSLKPTFYQIAPLSPCPGTQLFKNMANAGRLHDDYTWDNVQIWQDLGVKRQHFRQHEIKKYFDLAHEKLRTLHGPPPVQVFEDAISAYQTFRSRDGAFARFLAGRARTTIHKLTPVLQAIKNHPPSPQVRRRIKELEADAERILGRPHLWTRATRFALSILADWRMARAELPFQPAPKAAAPMRVAYYNGHGQKGPSVRRNVAHRNPQLGRGSLLPYSPTRPYCSKHPDQTCLAGVE